MFKIGDFSNLSKVSVKALRFYDEVGLLKPTFVDGATGYRYYSANLLSRLNRILVFKEFGFSLDQIALLLEKDLQAEQIRDALRSRREHLSNQIAQQQARLAQVDDWLTQIETEGTVPYYEIKLRQIAPQWVASVRDKLASYDEAAELFTELNHHLKTYSTNGRNGAVWHSCAGQAEQIDCEAIALLNRPIAESRRIAVYQLPASVNACLIHQGSDETITQAYLSARSWITEYGYEISGPLCELYWKGGVSGNGGSGVTEIRYPVLRSKDLASAGH